MTLWLVLALMTVVAIFAVLWPLVRHSVATRSGSDVVVYRDQLDEVERDLAAGLIGKTEAEAARIEISRRLLAAAEAAKNAPAVASKPWRRWAVAAVTIVALPLGAVALYLHVGSPGMRGEPLAARLKAPATSAQQSVDKLVAEVELHLQKHPNDGKGWQVLAPVYMQLGRFTDSVNAWQKAIQLLGESADRLADLGEALTAQAGGIVTAEAKADFERSVQLDNTTVIARYYLGLAAEQDGKRTKAAEIWRQLIADAPKNAKWVPTVQTALNRVVGKGILPLPGPTPAEMLAAAKKSPAQQQAMAIDMVDRLAERLKKDSGDVSGWVQLVHAYKVMGFATKQKDAIAEARKALAGNATKSKTFEAALKEIEAGKNPGVTPSMATTMPAAETTSAKPAETPMPGPTPAQMAAAAQQTPAQQQTMIRTMVGRLADQMKKDGSNVQGWERLVRAYQVLGEPDKHKAAIADARKALASDPAKLKQFNASLGGEAADPMTAAASSPTTGAAVDPPSPPAMTPLPGPTPMQMLAASEKPATQKDSMVEGMVKGLEKRLKTDTTDVQGWIMLVRSYKVLGERDKEKAAIGNARQALAKDSAKLQQFDTALIEMQGNPTRAPQAGAAGDMKQHQGASINEMVERLAKRLKASGGDPQGWLMLTRSYLTLKQNDKAMQSIKDARNALASKPMELDQFNAALKHFKIKASN